MPKTGLYHFLYLSWQLEHLWQQNLPLQGHFILQQLFLYHTWCSNIHADFDLTSVTSLGNGNIEQLKTYEYQIKTKKVIGRSEVPFPSFFFVPCYDKIQKNCSLFLYQAKKCTIFFSSVYKTLKLLIPAVCRTCVI